MDRYIGTKIILAEPQFKEIGREAGPDRLLGRHDESTGGQLVAGYKVLYEDGYVSWSPKDVFERCYRRISDAEIDMIENHNLKGLQT